MAVASLPPIHRASNPSAPAPHRPRVHVSSFALSRFATKPRGTFGQQCSRWYVLQKAGVTGHDPLALRASRRSERQAKMPAATKAAATVWPRCGCASEHYHEPNPHNDPMQSWNSAVLCAADPAGRGSPEGRRCGYRPCPYPYPWPMTVSVTVTVSVAGSAAVSGT